jgi:hypothetical protein
VEDLLLLSTSFPLLQTHAHTNTHTERMLDINLFRVEKGGNPDLIRESQRRRFANVEIVDEIIRLDKEWRQRNHYLSLSLNL